MSQKPRFISYIEYLSFRTLEPVVCVLPWNATLKLGRVLGRLAHFLDPRHRRVVRENLRMCDLDMTEAEVRETSKACFEHYGAMSLLMFHLLHMDREELERRVRMEGVEHWHAARSLGKGFIVLTGHYGCWEAMSLMLNLKGSAFSVIGRKLDNPLLDPYLQKLRSRWGNRVILKRGAMREALQVLKQGEGVGFLLDQDALSGGIFIKFLGQWASTHSAAAVLAVKHEIPVLPVFSWPNPDGSISVRIDPHMIMPRTGDRERDVWVATQIMTRCLEDQVRKDPRWWFWMHRRFKTRPVEGRSQPSPLPPPEWIQSVPSTVNRG
ncbi:MAG TPA: lysophospholipid acyltransferase family protein [Holophaga sp.]|nr:lysophospholipid acyltransferase family protein [Holophaga sp.]HPS67095.1 lysophospholipid acyltransferase family protein [Holophaga sp.]